MESVKKLLPYLLVAVIFAVGGYFIGHGKLNDQGAALYKATNRAFVKDPNVSSTGPTGGDGPAGTIIWDSTYGCIAINSQGVMIGQVNFSKKDCHDLAPKPDENKVISRTGTTSSDSSLKIIPGNVGIPSIFVWVDSLGCLYFTLDGRWTTTNIPEEDCHAIRAVNTTTNIK